MRDVATIYDIQQILGKEKPFKEEREHVGREDMRRFVMEHTVVGNNQMECKRVQELLGNTKRDKFNQTCDYTNKDKKHKVNNKAFLVQVEGAIAQINDKKD